MSKRTGYRLLMPLMVLLVLLVLNLVVDVVLMNRNPDARSFFSLGLAVDSYGNTLLRGDIINVLNSASELVILAIGMTLVTAVSGGQDISVGAVAAVAGSVFIKAAGTGEITWGTVFMAFIACCLVAMLCGAFNGALVAVFRIQPMIATLVMFTAGRSIAYAINGNASPKLYDDLTRQIGSYFSGVPIPTSIFLVIIYVVIFFLLFRFTNLRLYLETVGINEKSARLNGLNPVFLKLLAYIILGFCVAAAGFLNTCRMQRLDHLGILGGIEMDAILAVAIGGNALGGRPDSVTVQLWRTTTGNVNDGVLAASDGSATKVLSGYGDTIEPINFTFSGFEEHNNLGVAYTYFVKQTTVDPNYTVSINGMAVTDILKEFELEGSKVWDIKGTKHQLHCARQYRHRPEAGRQRHLQGDHGAHQRHKHRDL